MLRRQSEERIKTELIRQRSQPSAGEYHFRYRHSLLMDLDVDIDIGDVDDSTSTSAPRTPTKSWKPAKPTSPGAKSVDIGCVNMKYYDDYQVLDISPFLDKEHGKNATAALPKSPEKKLSYAIIPPLHERPIEALREKTLDDSSLNDRSGVSKEQGSPTNQERTSTDSCRDSKPVILTMEDFEITSTVGSPELTKDSKPMLVHHISVIKEEDGDDEESNLTNSLDHITITEPTIISTGAGIDDTLPKTTDLSEAINITDSTTNRVVSEGLDEMKQN